MRVLYLIDSLDRSGGAEQALASMTPCLIERGIDLDIAYLVERDGLQRELRRAGAKVTAVPGSSRAARALAFRNVIRRQRPDLVHTTLFESDVVGRLGAFSTGTPVVSSLVNAAYGPDHRGDPALSTVKVRAAQTADALSAQATRRFHALTAYVAQTMSRRLGVRRSRIEVIPRGRSSSVLGTRSAARRESVRRRLDVPLGGELVVAAARHEHQKGLDVLIEAFARLPRSVPAAHLVIAGREGKVTPLLRRTIQQHGVAATVHVLGPRADVPDLMAAADLFVAPSRWEGLGSAIVEAMGIGTPIVASDVPAIRETAAGAALFAPPGSADGLARAMTDALADRGASAERAKIGRARFSEHYTIERVADRMIDFYGRALGTRRRIESRLAG